jgi:tetratricopeptide (TPR) repeat protein
VRTTSLYVFASLLLSLAGCAAARPASDPSPSTGAGGPSTQPTTAAEHAARANALAERGDQDDAIKEFEQAIALEPGNPTLHFTLAVWMDRWHMRGAVPHLDAALPLVQNDYPMTVAIGHEYRIAGEFGSCVTTFDTAIKSQDSGEARTERALCSWG